MTVDPRLLTSLQARLVGPYRGGRVVAVAGHPTDAVTFYFGALQALPRLFAWVTAVFTVTSGLQYIMQGLKQINPPPGVGERS